MAYGKIKAEALIYNNSGNDVELAISDIVTSSGSLSAYALLAGATFTGDVNFDGGVIVKGDSTNGSGALTLNCENNSHGVKIKGPPHSAAANYTLTLPNNTGTSGQVLTTNGSGVSSWSTIDLSSKLSLTGGTLTGGLTGTTANFSGNVGIGTSTISRKFVVSGGSSEAVAQFTNATSGVGADDGFQILHFNNGYTQLLNRENESLSFGTNNTERMRIDSSGNVGIGTSSPIRALQVGSHGSGNGEIALASSTAGNCTIFMGDGATGVDYYRGFIQYKNSLDAMLFATSNTERLRIDSSGNVGIGTTSPGSKLEVHSSGSTNIVAKSTNGNGGYLNYSGLASNGAVTFSVNHNGSITAADSVETPRLNLASSGSSNMLVGYDGTTPTVTCTASGNLKLGNLSSGGNIVLNGDSGSARFRSTVDIEFNSSQTTGLQLKNAATGTAARIYYGSSIVGSITNTTSATAFNTSSDYRLKENVVDITNGITRVKQLQPKRFNFIADADTTVDGFLAHEAQAVVPEAVTGEKDGEEMQGIDQSKLVPLLTAALQEAIGEIETLKQRLSDAGIA